MTLRSNEEPTSGQTASPGRPHQSRTAAGIMRLEYTIVTVSVLLVESTQSCLFSVIARLRDNIEYEVCKRSVATLLMLFDYRKQFWLVHDPPTPTSVTF